MSPFHARQAQEPVESRIQNLFSAAWIEVVHGGAAGLGKTGRGWDHLAKKTPPFRLAPIGKRHMRYLP